MASVKDHYQQVLSDVYSWMLGGFDAAVQRNSEFFAERQLRPRGSAIAVDLGAGCGFQSIPLARAGYTVTAIDIDEQLLGELSNNAADLPITTVQDDLMHFDQYVGGNIELAVCMTDTIVHLESKQQVSALFAKVFAALHDGGQWIITFRDLTYELSDLERFIPVKSDDNIIFTCFLEYEPETVKVHDIVYKKSQGQWALAKSFYRKLRLSQDWMTDQLSSAGFNKIDASDNNGMITLIASK